MKVNTLNLYMGSIYNGKRVGDMTFYEVYRLAYDLIMVKMSCNQVVLLQKLMMPRGSSWSLAERISYE